MSRRRHRVALQDDEIEELLLNDSDSEPETQDSEADSDLTNSAHVFMPLNQQSAANPRIQGAANILSNI